MHTFKNFDELASHALRQSLLARPPLYDATAAAFDRLCEQHCRIISVPCRVEDVNSLSDRDFDIYLDILCLHRQVGFDTTGFEPFDFHEWFRKRIPGRQQGGGHASIRFANDEKSPWMSVIDSDAFHCCFLDEMHADDFLSLGASEGLMLACIPWVTR